MDVGLRAAGFLRLPVDSRMAFAFSAPLPAPPPHPPGFLIRPAEERDREAIARVIVASFGFLSRGGSTLEAGVRC